MQSEAGDLLSALLEAAMEVPSIFCVGDEVHQAG